MSESQQPVQTATERVQPLCPLCGEELPAPDPRPAGNKVAQVTCQCGAEVKAVFTRTQKLQHVEEGDELYG